MFKVFIALTLTFAVGFPAFAVDFTSTPELRCNDILAGKSFDRDGFEVLAHPDPLTPTETRTLHQKLVQFIHETSSSPAGEYTFILKQTDFDYIYKPGMLTIPVQSTPALLQMPEMQKLLAWVKIENQSIEQRLHKENSEVRLLSTVLNVGTASEPMYEKQLNKHSDSVYARLINTLLGPTTLIYEDGKTYTPEKLKSVLLSGTFRLASTGIMATSHASPAENATDRMLLRMTYNTPISRAVRILAPQSDVKLTSLEGLKPTFAQHGFEFMLHGPISISKTEAQQLVDAVRNYYLERGLPIEHTELVLRSDEVGHLIPPEKAVLSRNIRAYLQNIRHPVYQKIVEQVGVILSQPDQYIKSRESCRNREATLRLGFKEHPLYTDPANPRPVVIRYHQDGVFERILAPLLGEPTEIYSPHLNTRLDIPSGIGTWITGRLLSKEGATWHRAPGLINEDRALLTVTCTY